MRGIQRIANLDGEFQGLIDRQGPLDLSAFDVLHDQVIRADIVQSTNIGMIQCRDCTSFVLEPFGEPGAGNLDGDDAIEARIARLINFTHSARTDGREVFRTVRACRRERAASGSELSLADARPI